jgi:hypothetical protein
MDKKVFDTIKELTSEKDSTYFDEERYGQNRKSKNFKCSLQISN